jgi:hypothetical protein
MNERIKELIQAQNSDRGLLWTEEDKEEFGMLFVKECALVIQDFVDHRFPASGYSNRLKKYFGVDE